MAKVTLREVINALQVLEKADIGVELAPKPRVSVNMSVVGVREEVVAKVRKQRRHKITEEDLVAAETLRGSGSNWTEIAREIGCSVSAIRSHFE